MANLSLAYNFVQKDADVNRQTQWVDVLDLTGREDLLYWLDGLAADGEIDTERLFGTLKAPPERLPGTVEAYWLDRGAVVGLREAA